MDSAATPTDLVSSCARERPLEREHELALVGEALTAARAGRGQVILVDGPAGIGKSTIVSAAHELARQNGMRLMAARGSALERDLPFGVALELLEPWLTGVTARERRALFSSPAALARPLFERAPGRRRRGGEPAASEAVQGLSFLARSAAKDAPLVLSVDDVHWADSESLRVLLHVTQRVEELPIALMLALRSGEPGVEDGLLERLRAHRPARILRPAPLSPSAVRSLVRQSLPGAGSWFAERCAEITLGNPFLVREVLGSIETRQAGSLPEIAPRSLVSAISIRLASLPAEAAELARAVAILGDGAELRHAASLADLSPGDASEVADVLARTEILRPGEPLAFAQPLVRAATYAGLRDCERGRRHARAARALARNGASAEEVGSQLLLTPPRANPWPVGALRRAACHARARGMPALAARYLRRALEEPPPASLLTDVIVELGEAEAAAGDANGFDRLHGALRLIGPGEERGSILYCIGRTLGVGGRLKQATEAFERGLRAVDGTDPQVASQLRVAHATLVRLGLPESSGAGSRASLRGRAARGAASAEPVLLAHSAFELAMVGTGRERVGELAHKALGRLPLLRDEAAGGIAVYLACCALTWADELEASERHLTAAIDAARRRGSAPDVAAASLLRAHARYRRGRITDALADVEGLRRGSRLVGGTRTLHALLLLERGEAPAAGTTVDLSDAEEEWSHSAAVAYSLAVRGRLRLLEGKAGDAHEDFIECGRLLEAAGVFNPSVLAWRSDAGLAAARLGDAGEAARLVDQELSRAREFGAPRVTGIALRAAGVVEGGEEGIDLLRESQLVLEGSAAPLELARTLADLGGALRRSGHRLSARDPLRRALDLAHRLGALGLAETARAELVATGARPRRAEATGWGALTPAERRVATMAAKGMRNREIAQALCVTLKTVQWHLRQVYRKLGAGSSRESLRAAWRAASPPSNVPQ